MRTIDDVTRADGGEVRSINLRPLSRKEIRGMKDIGYTFFGWQGRVEDVDEALDTAFAKVLTEDDRAFLEECGNKESYRIWQELLKETYGDRTEEKNSSTTSAGDTTGTGPNTAGGAESGD